MKRRKGVGERNPSYTLGRSSGFRVRGSFPAELPVTAMSEPPKDPEYVLRGVAGVVFGRSYHLLAMPTMARRIRIGLDWAVALASPHDIAELGSLGREDPRAAF